MTVEGNNCSNGVDFAKFEFDNPTRMLTTTVRTEFNDVPVLSVRTDGEIPKEMMMEVLKEIKDVVVKTELACGDTLIEDVAETGVRVIVTSSALMNLGAELINKNVELNKASGSTGGEFEPDGTGADAGGTGAMGGEGIGIVRNSLDDAGNSEFAEPATVLDDLGDDPIGGFVGAAGEAVGVEDPIDDEDDKPKGRARIKINK